MPFVADLHIHSYLSRACSPLLRTESLHRWCQLKGVTVLATGDFTHPRWIEELRENLVPAEDGLFMLRPDLAAASDVRVPASCRAPVRFVLGVEISCIYKKGARVRKVHHLVFMPTIEAADRFNAHLDRIGNIKSDGRPILGLDSKDLLSIALEASENAHLIPAHAWTPHFGVFGSQSGFDSLEECFEDLAPRIFSVETGLSSDPPMNWRVSALDRLTLISNSDAHSPEKLAREANLFDTELSYDGLFNALRRKGPGRLVKTFEFFPEEGKYHLDGHRKCETRLTPAQTLAAGGRCPKCTAPVTVGVLHRVEKLADRAPGVRPDGAADFENLVSLKEILGQLFDVGSGSARVDREYHRLLAAFGNELHILRNADLERMSVSEPSLAQILRRMRQGLVDVIPGYDGEYGIVSVATQADLAHTGQMTLL